MRNLAWASLLALALGPGCSTHKETVTTTETISYPSDTVLVQRSETTTTTTDSSGSKSGGVLSSTVDVVGDVIALPFRAVGSLLGALF